jgi:hypothetical protein
MGKANIMFFSERKRLAEEYETWVNQPLKDGAKIKDCPLSVITFMHSKGFVKINENEIVISKEEYETKKKIVAEWGLLQQDIMQGKMVDTVAIRKETARDVYIAIIALINNAEDKLPKIFPNNSEYKKGYENSVKHFKENIIKIAKQFGVEVEE